MHELAHLWVGSSGISNASPGNTRREEVFCNAVAGEFLVPQDVFIPLWTASLPERLAELAQRFHVSRLVIMRRALDLALVNHVIYTRIAALRSLAFDPSYDAPDGASIFYSEFSSNLPSLHLVR